MLEGPRTTTTDTPDSSDVVLVSRDLLERLQGELKFKQTRIDALNFEVARLKRWRFGSSSESLDTSTQAVLFDSLLIDTALEDRAADEANKSPASPPRAKGQAVRQALPASLPRVEHRHEIAQTHCACGQAFKRIGEEVSEQLDCVPAQFFVLRHIRGKYACACCQTMAAAPMPAQMIDKGIPAPGLLAQVAVAKHDDHLPLYRQEAIFGRAGLAIPRSTLAQWVGSCGVQLQPLVDAMRTELLQRRVLHADETPVSMLKPGNGKAHRAYLWAYATGAFENIKAVVYDFCESRSGEHARRFLGDWRGSLTCDDFSGYKALIASGVTEVGCLAHARRKFFDLHAANQSQIAEVALQQFARVYEIEREVKEIATDQRQTIRQQQTKPLLDALHQWMVLQRQKVPEGSASAKALDYSLRRWEALTRFVDDGQLPVDNNWIENQIRPIAIGRNNWLFAGSLRAGQRAAAVMTLIQSARLNGHDPYAYLKDVLARLPTQRVSLVHELLPHRWFAPS